MQAAKFGRTAIRIVQGDVTRERADAIVNAANSGLLGGGGVDGAIHRAGGPAIAAECERIRREKGGCPTGQAVPTTAGRLDAKAVLHAVGPIWMDSDPEECDRLLASAYTASLRLARDMGMRSVAFPSISTGAYGFPIERAASIALRTVREFLEAEEGAFDEIRFVLFSDRDRETYEAALTALSKA
jgi:O-acetyl-ADP-ribose deacetylase (regulator of RNase III)